MGRAEIAFADAAGAQILQLKFDSHDQRNDWLYLVESMKGEKKYEETLAVLLASKNKLKTILASKNLFCLSFSLDLILAKAAVDPPTASFLAELKKVPAN